MPHGTDDSSLEFYKAELETFRKSLSRFAGREISDRSLKQATELYNKNRAKVRELYQLRKSAPPQVSGVEVAKVLVAAVSIPVEEATKLIGSVIDEVKQRKAIPAPKSARLMVVGTQMDNVAFIDLVEKSGAWVVADDLCPGARESLAEVNITADPIDGIAERYLRRIYCGRSYRQRKGSYPEYMEERFGHIGSMIRDFKVDGVVLYIYKYCDPLALRCLR